MASETPHFDTIFFAAIEMPSAEDRAAYILRACGNDEELLGRVEKLVGAHFRAGNFMDSPAADLPACLAGEGSEVREIATLEEPIREITGTVIGPYKLLQQLGEGGMGTVFMAEQTQPVQRKVALKVIKAGMDSHQIIARFEAERQALAMMDHVNIARVLDAGTTGGEPGGVSPGRPYFVMELVHGVPITKYCDDNHLTPRQRLELFVPVCQAIQHAHQKGIIHRDIKPSNVMVTLYDGKPVPKVIDFGVAKATEQRLTERTLFTQYGSMVGTLEYMSPEQAEMSALGVDTRSDIFSLGVLLYELLTGSTPLSHKRVREAAYGEILRMIKEEEPPRPSTRLSDSGEALASISAQRHMEPAKLTKLVRGELDWIVMKSLEKDRNRRYETANGFAADVQCYLSDEPVQACPPSAWYRFRKFARRNKRSLATATLLSMMLLAAVGTVAGTIGWATRDRAAREEEITREQTARLAALEREVKQALDEAQASYKLDRLPEAMSAAKRAEGLLASGGSEELQDRVRELRKDLDMVLCLEEIRFQQPAGSQAPTKWMENDRAYATAFREYGIDIQSLQPKKAADLLRARPIGFTLAAALDYWAYVCRVTRKHDGNWRHLLAVARVADPDEYRNRIRDAIERFDRQALRQLAATEKLHTLPVSTLHHLTAIALRSVQADEEVVSVLRKAQKIYTGDFAINSELAGALSRGKPPQWEEAVRYGSVAVALRPKNAVAHSNLGVILENRKRRAEAKECYLKAIELKPNYANPYVGLGAVLTEEGRWKEAIVAFRHAIRLKPNYDAAHNNLGVALEKIGSNAEAIASFKEAIRLKPDYSEAHRNLGVALAKSGAEGQAINSFKEAIRLKPDDAEAHHSLGVALEQKGAYEEAIAIIKEAIRLKPDCAEAHYNLGVALAKSGAEEQAIASFQEAIRLKPDFGRAHYNLGVALKAKGLLDQGIAAYKEAVRLEPDYAPAHNNLGCALEEKGAYKEAIAACKEAVRLKPDYALAHISLARLLTTCPDPKFRDPVRALGSARKAVELHPQSAAFSQMLGWAHYRTGAWKEAIKALEKSMDLQKDGGDPEQWFVLAMAYWQLGEKDQARKWYDQAVAWMAKHRSQEEHPILRRFRVEAAALLGILKPLKEGAVPKKEKKPPST